MIFWLISLLFIGGSVFAVLFALRGNQTTVSGNAHDMEVYRAQIVELDRDAKRGQISEAEAEQARVEIGRRLIAADDALAQEEKNSVVGSTLASKIAASAALLLVPALTFGLYSILGSPAVPDNPLQARRTADPANLQITDLVGRAEKALATNPDDPRGWAVLAPIYIRLNRLPDAIVAYRNLVRLESDSVAHKIALAEALTLEAQNVVTPEARQLFTIALKQAPNHPKPKFYVALAQTQAGEHKQAVKSWSSLIAASPANAPWLDIARKYLTTSAKEAGVTLQASTLGNPTSEDIAAASSMTAEDRQGMILNMVDQLADKLKSEPENVEGWLRLIRSYTVLNKPELAKNTYAEARKALKNVPQGLEKIAALASELNIESGVVE